MAGTQVVDLVCNEVIVEEQIEPPVVVEKRSHTSAGAKYATTKRTSSSSQYFQATPQEKLNDQSDSSIRTTPRDSRSRDCCGPLKRRRLWDSESFVHHHPKECRGGGGISKSLTEYEDAMHTLLSPEIRWKILSLLRKSELMSIRKVSRTWKVTIDSFIKVNVRLEGDSKTFQGKCGLSMKSCELVSLQNPSHRQLFKSPVPEEVKITRGICSLNFEELLFEWRNLSKLEICWRSTMRNLLFGKKGLKRSVSAKNVLPNLTNLKLEMLINDNLGKRTQLRILSNISNLSSFDFPSLTEFSIAFVGYRELHSENRHLSVILPFIKRHMSSLSCINFTLKYTSHIVYPPAHPRHILFCVPANIKTNYRSPQSSSDGHLVTTQLRKLNSSQEHHLEWVKMLGNTRKLEVTIMTRFLSWSIKHFNFFQPVIKEYSKFLSRVDIMNVTMYDSGAHNTVTQLDAKIFAACLQLTQLRVYRAPIIFHEDEIEPPTELINLHCLPTTLEELVVDGLPVSSLEILEAIANFTNLKGFHYFQSQVPRRNMLSTNGINWDILQSLIRHPTLINVKVHVTTTSQVLSHTQYEEPLKKLAKEHDWNTTGIVPGYMNMFQITLTKPK